MASSKKHSHTGLMVLLGLLLVLLIAAAACFGLLSRRLSTLQKGASFDLTYEVTPTAADAPALYSILNKVGAAQGSIHGQYAPGKLQLALYPAHTLPAAAGSTEPFTRLYIDSSETLYDAGQLYTYLRKAAVDNIPLADLLLPGWTMGSYLSQAQLADVLGVPLAAVEMQEMTQLRLALDPECIQHPADGKEGWLYYQFPAEGTDAPVVMLGFPPKALFDEIIPVEIRMTIPAHGAAVTLSGTLSPADTSALAAPTSRMSDEDVASFVQLCQALENLGQLLDAALQAAKP